MPSLLKRISLLGCLLIAPSAIAEQDPSDLPQTSSNLRPRKLSHIPEDIVVINGGETGPFSLSPYNDMDPSGTIKFFRTQQIVPRFTEVICQMRMDERYSGSVQYLTLQAGSLPTDVYGDTRDSCYKPSQFSTSCQVQFISTQDEYFYLMVVSNLGNIINAYIRCTADGFRFTPAPSPFPLPTTPAPSPPTPTTMPVSPPFQRPPPTPSPTGAPVAGPPPSCWDILGGYFSNAVARVTAYWSG